MNVWLEKTHDSNEIKEEDCQCFEEQAPLLVRFYAGTQLSYHSIKQRIHEDNSEA